MSYYTGRRVLVTGAASGIGLSMAEKMGAAGARLVLWDLNANALERVRAGFADAGIECVVEACDVTDRAAVRAAAGRVLREHGPVDVLVNNAGIVSGSPLLELSDEQIERTLAVNTLALFWTTRAFLPAMIEQGRGHIVTIASAAGLVGTARQTDYAASKYAAVGFDEALRCELRHLGLPIRTTVVCPYYIATGMFAGVKTGSVLLPILDPERTARRIVDAIARGQQRLFLPPIVGATYLLRVLPTNLFDWAMRRLGVARSMDEFKGRSPRS